MSAGVFLTATDTGVGKTTVGLLICEYFNQSKIPYFPYKPVESGADPIPRDAHAYYVISKERYTLEEICPFPLKDAVAPALAANREKKRITRHDILQPLKDHEEFILIEGAGGWYTPLTEDGTVADLAKDTAFPVLFIIHDRLGAVNQAVLTYKAIESSGLIPAAGVLNFYNPELNTDNLEQLQRYLPCPVFPLPEKFVEPDIFRFYNFFSRFIYSRYLEPGGEQKQD